MTTYTITLPGKPGLYHPAPLSPGWEAVGEIRREGEAMPGALVRNAATGVYAQADAGTIRDLDPRQVALALVATVPGVDIEGEQELTTSEGAVLLGRSAQTITAWARQGIISRCNPENPGPAKYRKSDLVAAKNRSYKVGRPKKTG